MKHSGKGNGVDTPPNGLQPAHPGQKNDSILHYPHLLLGILCLFLAVGVEVMAGDAIGTYGRSLGIGLETTKYFTTFTLLAMLKPASAYPPSWVWPTP